MQAPACDSPPAASSPAPGPPDRPDRPDAGALRRRAIRGGSLLLATRLGAQLFQWAATLLIAGLLEPSDYGLMATAMLVVGLADMLAEAGVGRALIHKKNLTAFDQAQAFSLSVLLAAGLYALVWLAADPLAGHLERPELAFFVRVLALVLWLVPIQAVAGALLERHLELGKQSAVHFLVALAQTGLVLGLAVAGFGYWALGAGLLVSRGVQTVLVWYASGWRPTLAWPAREAWELLRYGLQISLGGLLWFVYSNADYAVLSGLLGTVALGHYYLAFQLISLPVQKLSANINQIAFAVFCRLQDDRERMRHWFLRVVVMLTVVATPALIGLALVAGDAIPLLLGERWREAVVPFQLLCPIGALMVVSYALPPVFNALGRPDVNLKFTALCATIFPIAFFVLGSEWGIVGVCAAWLIFYPLLVVGLFHLTRSITGITLASLVLALWPVLLSTAGMSGAVLAAQALLPGEAPSLTRLVTGIAVGAVTYSACLLITGAAVLRDVRSLFSELRGRKGAE